MTSLILTGYILSMLLVLFSTLLVIGSNKTTPGVRVAGTLSNSVILLMLLYGLFHTPGLS